MRRLIYAPHAQADITAIYDHLYDQSGEPDIALRVVHRLRDKCEHLARLPGTLGTARPDLQHGLRSTPCGGYVIFYRYVGDELEILVILHSKRDVIAYFDELTDE
jgi:toxin ParE1/3/4